jgi:class 3 adenylate cyclase/tetratricopeptide (TPR) repeat protein
MAACPACAFPNPDAAKFCMDCATPLAPAPRPVTEERRVVTIVFGDLVGFTARAEALDPEDVRAFLVPYYELLTVEIERHGGVVDKLLGDGVMAVFGSPIAHEDDPERAIRTCLRVLERLPALGLDLQLRFGVNTGQVVVATEGAERGDAITGDAANTAARLQTVAPVGAVVVGEATWRATQGVFEYEELPPAVLKGKSEPVRVFRPVAARGHHGLDVLRARGTRLVGRDGEVARITGLFDHVVGERRPGMALVVGEPGLGKSRLVAGLFEHADATPDILVTWRQGRCLPYGDGIAFWALGEIVKAHAGILESDDATVAAAKLDAVLPDEEDRPWLHARLLPLVGLEPGVTAPRGELFAAWRRFVEVIAAAGPAVLVFEDLHWADPALLEFLATLAGGLRDAPLLIVGTARPELFDTHGGFGDAIPDLVRLDLGPLDDAETTRLVAALLEADEVPPAVAQPILEGAGGNPLYAEQFVRLLRDEGILVATAGQWSLTPGVTVPSPPSVEALIAARLDTLAPRLRATLVDASVIGKVFWGAAVAAVAGRDVAAVRADLEELARREFVRPAARSSIQGEHEYAFWHALTRDVAYSQLSRRARATRHIAVARWVEARSADRVEDVAEVLAHHYATALELTRAMGPGVETAALAGPAVHFLRLAGRRALGLRTMDALDTLQRALALMPADDPDRPALLMDVAAALYDAARNADAKEALEGAVAAYIARGDERAAAAALVRLSGPARALGDPGADGMVVRAQALLEPLGPSPELARALIERAGAAVHAGRKEAAVAYADEALAMASALGMPRPARALHFRGWARVSRSDPGWQDDFREAMRLAHAAADGRELVLIHLNFANHLSFFLGPRSAMPILQEGLALAEARGIAGLGDWIRMNLASSYVDTGDWDRALASVDDLLPRAEAAGDASQVAILRAQQVDLCMIRGDLGPARRYVGDLERRGEELAADPDRTYWLSTAARARIALGEPERAREILGVIAGDGRLRRSSMWWECLGPMLRAALAIRELGLVERLSDRTTSEYALGDCALAGAAAIGAEARSDWEAAVGRYAEAAVAWAAFGQRNEHAQAILGQGRCLLALGRADEAGPVLREARRRFEALGAWPAVATCDAMLTPAVPG